MPKALGSCFFWPTTDKRRDTLIFWKPNCFYWKCFGNCLAAQWLGFCASTGSGLGMIFGEWTKILQATWQDQKRKVLTEQIWGNENLKHDTLQPGNSLEILSINKGTSREFSGGPVVKTTCFSCQGHRFDSWWRGLRSHKLQGTEKKKTLPHELSSTCWKGSKYCYQPLCCRTSRNRLLDSHETPKETTKHMCVCACVCVCVCGMYNIYFRKLTNFYLTKKFMTFWFHLFDFVWIEY